MRKKLAIRGHSTRGKEVIELLEMLGGKNCYNFSGFDGYAYYVIAGCQNKIKAGEYIFGDEDMCLFTLEEFLEKYPFKVGDRVFLYDNITEGCITGMKWDEDKGTVKYCVYTSSEYWCDVKELLKWNNKAKAPDIKGENYSGKRFGYKIPDGYEFDVVVDGKIFIKPIKPKYPTSYEECCKVLGVSCRAQLSYTNPVVEHNNIYLTKEKHLLDAFMKLRIYRNAYWKIAGEEMGLGKSWEPDWDDETNKFTISNKCNKIFLNNTAWYAEVLSFPTAEMRDAFYENFKDLIEQCKELL